MIYVLQRDLLDYLSPGVWRSHNQDDAGGPACLKLGMGLYE